MAGFNRPLTAKQAFPWGTFASIVIAASALCVSAGSLYFTRRHQRLSVAPQLEIVLALDTKTVDGRTCRTREFCLRNHGLGPARITEYCFDFGAEKIAHNERELGAILRSKLNFPSGIARTYLLSLLPVNRTERILWFEPAATPFAEYQANLSFAQLRSVLRLTVTYESMYGEILQVSETFTEAST